MSEFPKIPWYNRLKNRILFGFLFLSLVFVAVGSVIVQKYVQQMTEEFIYERLERSQQSVLSGMQRRVEAASFLVDSLASIAVTTDFNADDLHRLIPSLIASADDELIIAGGGVWPEPFVTYNNKARDSYFWGRDAKDELQFFNDYNDLANPPYHAEEWYVPTKYLAAGQRYWSRSYIDPHTNEPMVTVSKAIVSEGEFLGAVTIDLKLSGLQQLLAVSIEQFEGYAFAVDRNGEFISSPMIYEENDEPWFEFTVEEHNNSESSGFEFRVEDDGNGKVVNYFSSEEMDKFTKSQLEVTDELMNLANSLESEVTGLQSHEAQLIASNIIFNRTLGAQPSQDAYVRQISLIERDAVLGEAVYVVEIYDRMRDWKIVSIIPEAETKESVYLLGNALNLSMFVLALSSFALIWLVIKSAYLNPVEKLTTTLKSEKDADEHNQGLLELNPQKGEIELLLYLFNLRSKEIEKSQHEIDLLAYYDPLTSLANRRKLRSYIKDIISEQTYAPYFHAVAFIDLDNFKNLNDSLGHQAGDDMLVESAKRIVSCVPDDSLVSRIGGDEFVIVYPLLALTETKAKDKINETSQAIIESLGQPYSLLGTQYYASASMGLYVFRSEGSDISTIFKHADLAMYHSKELGKNTFSFFEDSLKDKVEKRLQMESDLRTALAEDHLYLMYQPQISASGSRKTLEALIRWEHPTFGNIPPNQFIDIAEESALILVLGDWIIEKVCEQIKAWQRDGIQFDHVSINISPAQFKREQFLDGVCSILNEHDVPASLIMLELTEGIILENTQDIIEKINKLREIGFGISIDDFGTGYSSLSYLKNLPLNELKIDKSFVDGLGTDKYDALIVKAVISIADSFGYDVIAEGVETAQQRDILKTLGCNRYQGYYFSRPALPEAIKETNWDYDQ